MIVVLAGAMMRLFCYNRRRGICFSKGNKQKKDWTLVKTEVIYA